MTELQIPIKKIILRFVSVFFMLFSLLFGFTWKKAGFCMGDYFLTNIGLKAWSDGTQGIHYSALCSFVMLTAAFLIYSMTTEHHARTFRYFWAGLLVILVFANAIF